MLHRIESHIPLPSVPSNLSHPIQFNLRIFHRVSHPILCSLPSDFILSLPSLPSHLLILSDPIRSYPILSYMNPIHPLSSCLISSSISHSILPISSHPAILSTHPAPTSASHSLRSLVILPAMLSISSSPPCLILSYESNPIHFILPLPVHHSSRSHLCTPFPSPLSAFLFLVD